MPENDNSSILMSIFTVLGAVFMSGLTAAGIIWRLLVSGRASLFEDIERRMDNKIMHQSKECNIPVIHEKLSRIEETVKKIEKNTNGKGGE